MDKDHRPAEAPRSARCRPAEARRRAGSRRERLVTPSLPALPLREHLQSEAVAVHASNVDSRPPGTDKPISALPPGTDSVPTDHTQIEQENDW